MNFIVKNTTKNNILDIICPYYCRGCGRIGAVLCDCCKKYILDKQNGVFVDENDESPFKKVWVCGWRDGLLGRLVQEFKFDSARRIGDILAEIAYQVTIDLDEEMIVIPLPTIRRHIRERGLDHTMIIAKKIAKRHGWQVERLLARAQNNVQVGSDAKRRYEQAKEAYRLVQKITPGQKYLLVDDVWTTGASMCEAAKILKQNGAENIFGLVLVRNRMKLFGDALSAGFDNTTINADGVKNEVDDGKSED